MSALTTVVATDLDRTMIYSDGGDRVDGGTADRQVPPLLCVEMLDGRAQSFMTVQRGPAGSTLIGAAAVLVPVTTRTLAQFARVTLPGGPTPYAVTSNGGHIVVDGAADERMATRRRRADRRRRRRARARSCAGLDRLAAGAWVLNRKTADDLFCYLVVDLRTCRPASWPTGPRGAPTAAGWCPCRAGRSTRCRAGSPRRPRWPRSCDGSAATRLLAAGGRCAGRGLPVHGGCRDPAGAR